MPGQTIGRAVDQGGQGDPGRLGVDGDLTELASDRDAVIAVP
jgi:hypothetical protein